MQIPQTSSSATSQTRKLFYYDSGRKRSDMNLLASIFLCSNRALRVWHFQPGKWRTVGKTNFSTTWCENVPVPQIEQRKSIHFGTEKNRPELKAPSIFSKHADGKEFRIIVAHVFEREALINFLSKPCTQSIYPLNEQKCTFRRLENLEINSRSRYFRLLYFFIYSACWKRGRSKNH